MGAHKYNVAAKADRTVDGIVFASKKEMRRYQELKLLERAGEITHLELQPEFMFQPPFRDPKTRKHYRAIKYIADFAYSEPGNNARVVEDVKGAETQVFRLKMRMFKYKLEYLTQGKWELRIVR